MNSRVKKDIRAYIQRELTQRSSVSFYTCIVPRFCVNGVSVLDVADYVVERGCGRRLAAIGAFSPKDSSYEWFIGGRDNIKTCVAAIKRKGFEVDDVFIRGERFDYFTGEKTSSEAVPSSKKGKYDLFNEP
ncbi:MAG: hypothetical protein J4452_00460 [Candidatus Aenigmarchaeota archaeon]|nr:hypothetical protein [Candidatus Aenigmarchaeota archaeon]